jgi:RNA polymerase sigma-70 factor (ECF subfamily)
LSKQEKTDLELIQQVLNGDTEVYGTLVERYEKLVFSFLLARARCLQDVEDVVQEAFVRAYRHLRGFDQSRKFSAWLLTIARNLLFDLYKKNSRTLSSTDVVLEILSASSVSTSEETEQPSEIIMRRERFRRLLDLIRSLEEDLKVPFLLRVVNEMSYQDIADALDLPLQTVKNRIFKARTLLRAERDKDGSVKL